MVMNGNTDKLSKQEQIIKISSETETNFSSVFSLPVKYLHNFLKSDTSQ